MFCVQCYKVIMENGNKNIGQQIEQIKQPKELNQTNRTQKQVTPLHSDRTDWSKDKPQPLHLSPQALQQRLISLKSYDTWQHTKAIRINFAKLNQSKQAPIIQTVLAYGNPHHDNKILHDFIKGQKQIQKQSPPSVFEQLLSNHTHKQSNNSSQPSFVSFKTNQHQRQKIYKFINQSPRKHRTQHKQIVSKKSKHRTKTQMSLPTPTKYPRELAQLRQQLHYLPILNSNGRNTSATRNASPVHQYNNPQHETPSIYEQSQQSLPLQTRVRMATQSKRLIKTRKKRQNYLRDISAILDRSLGIMKNEDTILNDNIRKSEKSDLSSTIPQNTLKVKKRIQYWPAYSQFSVSQSTQQRRQQLLRQIKHLTEQTDFYSEDSYQLVKQIKKYFASQQSSMNKEVVLGQKNSFDQRYVFKLQAEKESYKRNMKEFVRSKKEYQLERQVEQVRANGIKRVRKVGMDKEKKWRVMDWSNQQSIQE